MKKEIRELIGGKSISFMSTVVEDLNKKSAIEYENLKIKAANGIIKESNDLDEDNQKLSEPKKTK